MRNNLVFSAMALALLFGVLVPVAGAVSISIDQGTSGTLIAQPLGGDAQGTCFCIYQSYQWYNTTSGSAVPASFGGNTNTIIIPGAATGPFAYNVVVTDFTGAVFNSTKSTITVFPDPTITLTPNRTSLDAGQRETYSFTITNGAGSFNVELQNVTLLPYKPEVSNSTLPSPSTSSFNPFAANFITNTPTVPGSFTFNAVATDRGSQVPYIFTSTSSTIFVYNALVTSGPTGSSAGISANPTTIDSGQSSTVTVQWSGGDPTYTIELFSGTTALGCTSYFSPVKTNSGISGTSTTFSVSPTSSTFYCAKVTDSASAPNTIATGTAEVIVDSSLAVSVAPAGPLTYDLGITPSTLTATVTSGASNPGISYEWYSSATSSCSSSSTNLATTSTTFNPSTSSTGTTYYCAVVTDSNGGTATSNIVEVTVDPTLAVSVSPPGPFTYDLGGSSTGLTATVTSGASNPGLSYSWYSSPTSSCSSSSTSTGITTTTFTPPTTPIGTLYYCAVVTDAGGGKATSNAVEVTIDPSLGVSVTPAGPLGYDQGLSSSPLSSTITSGASNPGISYEWYSSATSSCSSSSTNLATTSTTFNPSTSSTGTLYYCVVVTDSNGGKATSNAVEVTIYPDLGVSVSPPGPLVYDSGATAATLVASPTSGGSNPGLSYSWYSSSTSSCSSSSTSTGTTGTNLVPSTSSTGTTYYCAVLTDSNGGTATSNVVEVIVDPSLAVSVAPSGPLTYDLGATATTLTATVTSGASNPGLAYLWYKSATPSCSSSSASTGITTTTFTPPTTPTGTLYYCAVVTDSAGGSAVSNAVEVTIDTGITIVSVSPTSPITLDGGQSTTISVIASGGTGTYTYSWSIPNGIGSCPNFVNPGSVSSFTYTSASLTTNCVFEVSVTDTGGGSGSGTAATITVTIPAATLAPSNTVLDSGQTEVYKINVNGGVSPFNAILYNTTNGNQQGFVQIGSTPGSNTVTFTANYINSGNPNAFGTFTYNAVVYDFGAVYGTPTPFVFTSGTNTIIVHTSPSVSIGDPLIDTGQYEPLTATANGGIPPYTLTWYSCGAGSSMTNCATPSQIATNTIPMSGESNTIVVGTFAVGSYFYEAIITDSASTPETSTGITAITVNALNTPTITPGPLLVDSGQNVNLAASETGGSGVYAWQWYSGTPGPSTVIAGADSTGFSGTAPYMTGSVGTTGDFFVVVNDTGVDTHAYPLASADSLPDPFTIVGNALSVSLTPSSQSINTGSTATYTATVTGGTGNYIYTLYNASNGNSVVNSITSNTMSVTFNITGGNTGTFNYYVTANDLGTSPNDIVTSNTASLTVSSPPAPAPAPTPSGGGGGGGGGGAGLPTVIQSGACYTIYNFAAPDAETLTFPDTSFFIRLNFVSPTDAGFTVDNTTSYTLTIGKPATIGVTAANTYNMTLGSVSFVGLFDYVNVTVCAVAKPHIIPPANKTTTPTGPIVNLTIHNSTINATVSVPTDTVEILANGTVIATGTGTAIYNGSSFPAGTYKITALAPSPNVGSQPQLYVKPLLIPNLTFTARCTNSTYDRVSNDCLTVANISTINNQLQGNLYINGRYIGSTFTSISNYTSAKGNYTYVFNTTGNAFYSANSISYGFEITQATSTGGISPGLIAIVVGIAVAIAAAGAYAYDRSQKPTPS